jgi:hypothetical protein
MGRCEQVIPNSGNVKKAEQVVKKTRGDPRECSPVARRVPPGWFLLPSLACVCGPRG